MRLMKISVIGILAFCCALAVCSLFGIENFYTHPIFLVGVSVLAVLQAICIIRYKFGSSLRNIAFYVCHIGLILLFCGSVLSYCFAKSVNFSIPVTTSTTYREIKLNNGDVINFGFSIAVAGFRVETADDGSNTQYTADMRIYDNDEEKPYELKINCPVSYMGWKFYLMGYDAENNDSVAMYVKKDIGSVFLLVGFITTDIGTALLCFSKLGSKKKVAVENEL